MIYPPEKHFMHPQTSYFVSSFFFYAFGNTPPTDLLQHIPHDAEHADVLSLGCGDLRDLLYSILLHGRRPRTLSFVLNDWEPAIHARNLVLLQLFLDARKLLESGCPAEVDGITAGVEAVHVQCGRHTGDEKPQLKKGSAPGDVGASGPAFAERVGVIFSAMYNVFVDKDVLTMILDVAARLAASAATPSEWASTELGALVRFTDDRSQDRVRGILSSYTDGSLHEKGEFTRIKEERSSLLNRYLPKSLFTSRSMSLSRSMGLSSLRQPETMDARDDMRRQYYKEGVLDPFPLLREEEGAPSKRRDRAELVNPLLLVTERQGTKYCVHYAAFPLQAFNTDVTFWKLQPEGLQGEYSRHAPRVTKHEDINSYIGGSGPSVAPIARRVAQNSWLGAALEELAQMCGAFLKATMSHPRMTIDVHVGDALDFCDALFAVPPKAGGVGDGAATSAPIPPIAFQKGTLQPLELRADVFGAGQPAFDVIKSSNLADHLGIVNVVMVAAPLLKEHSQALLLSSYLATTEDKHLYQGTAGFYEKLLCMSAHTASVILGVVPVPSISSVVGHTDVLARLDEGASLLGSSIASQLRLAWKHPPQALAATMPDAGPTGVFVDITPDDFASLVLPVYKSMFEHMPSSGMRKALRSRTMPNHYTSVTFGRLLVLAGRNLRLGEAHFEAALQAVVSDSGLSLAPNLQQEQAAVFHTLGLGVPPFLRELGTRRVVLLVPKAGLLLLRAVRQAELYLALSGKVLPFDNNFAAVHTAFVRVRRGKTYDQDGDNGWRSLSEHLMVRDTKEDDPEAELMASALVPTFVLTMVPPALTELELRPQHSSPAISAAAKNILKQLEGPFNAKVFYRADLSNIDQTAVLTPGETGDCVKGVVARPCLACPEEAVATRPETTSSPSSTAQPAGIDSSRPAFTHRFMHGDAAVDQSIELVEQAGDRTGTMLLYRVTLNMGSAEARKILAGGRAPVIDKTLDPCTVRVTLGEAVSHVTSFPFPVRRNSIKMKFSKREGFVLFTVPPLPAGESKVPFAWTACDVQGGGRRILPSTPAWSPCPPLASLPRLDFKAEWAHSKVMGGLSFTPAEKSLRDGVSVPNDGDVDQAFLGLKVTMLNVAHAACSRHDEEKSSRWKHPWVCISENRRFDEPAVWVWVNDILLDSSNEALVLDCCVMPVKRIGDDVSAQLGFAVDLDTFKRDGPGIMFRKAYPGEMVLWDALLPVVVERARQTYTHTAECGYTRPGGSGWTLCRCGKGKDLPSAFKESMKEINASGSLVHPLFYRAALSPLFAPAEAFSAPSTMKKASAAAAGCGKCGKRGKAGKALMKCGRCRKAEYCSKDCQRLDWKTHKRNCSTG